MGEMDKHLIEAATAVPGTTATKRNAAQGLYDPANEHDACGIGMIANIKNAKSHEVVQKGLEILENLEHRGAVGADPLMGDGAGILTQIPHAFFDKVTDFDLPDVGQYAPIMIFYPNDTALRDRCAELVRKTIAAEGLEILGERVVPFDNSALSEGVIATQPIIEQMFVARPEGLDDIDAFERKLLITRKVISNTLYGEIPEVQDDNGFYIVSMSARTIVYKGMFLADQLGKFYPDLHDTQFQSAIALVHQRFSTNTFPSWKLAHPYRMTIHNGEINTIRGNVNWMAARQASVASPKFGDDITKIWPISYEGQSDTACFDNALEFLVRGGYSLPHAAMMLIPEAWAGNSLMDEERRAFYEYHAALMEPWDGPAAMSLSDGRHVVATLDRNGLRPARYLVPKEDHVVLASESGVLDIPDEDVVERWRLQPGRMLFIDLEEGRIVSDDEIKKALAGKNPYATWLAKTQIVLEDLPDALFKAPATTESTTGLQYVAKGLRTWAPLEWGSKRHGATSRNTTEAEITATSDATFRVGVPIQSFLERLLWRAVRLPSSPPRSWRGGAPARRSFPSLAAWRPAHARGAPRRPAARHQRRAAPRALPRGRAAPPRAAQPSGHSVRAPTPPPPLSSLSSEPSSLFKLAP